ncbi:MAG: pilus assembly protein [Acidimicrobiia bacterium]|nr:pilus assembly protein [Acidimicrobiia bacterium]
MPARTYEDEGAAMLEFALVFVVFLVVVFGIVDFGLAISANTQISNAGREGARMATLVSDPVAVEQRIRDSASGQLNPALLTVTIECVEPGGNPCVKASVSAPAGDLRNAEPGDKARITVGYPYTLLTPLPGFINVDSLVDLRSITEMRIE